MTDRMIVTLRMTVRPGRRTDLAETIRGMLEPTRVERGCISYCLYEDIENKNTFALVEEWKTRDDLEKHVRTDNYRRLLALMDLLSEPPQLQFNTVSQTAGMELLSTVPFKT
jgi:quinol monooxygenase YgiN